MYVNIEFINYMYSETHLNFKYKFFIKIINLNYKLKHKEYFSLKQMHLNDIQKLQYFNNKKRDFTKHRINFIMSILNFMLANFIVLF